MLLPKTGFAVLLRKKGRSNSCPLAIIEILLIVIFKLLQFLMLYSVLVGNKSVGMSVGVLCAWEQCLIGGVGKQVPYPIFKCPQITYPKISPFGSTLRALF